LKRIVQFKITSVFSLQCFLNYSTGRSRPLGHLTNFLRIFTIFCNFGKFVKIRDFFFAEVTNSRSMGCTNVIDDRQTTDGRSRLLKTNHTAGAGTDYLYCVYLYIFVYFLFLVPSISRPRVFLSLIS